LYVFTTWRSSIKWLLPLRNGPPAALSFFLRLNNEKATLCSFWVPANELAPGLCISEVAEQ
jgi:hypothetical protein